VSIVVRFTLLLRLAIGRAYRERDDLHYLSVALPGTPYGRNDDIPDVPSTILSCATAGGNRTHLLPRRPRRSCAAQLNGPQIFREAVARLQERGRFRGGADPERLATPLLAALHIGDCAPRPPRTSSPEWGRRRACRILAAFPNDAALGNRT
jgi:hypothetical protein